MTSHRLNGINACPAILMEGAVIERLRRETDLELDPQVLNTALIYDREGRLAMARIYAQYIEIAAKYRLPILVAAPTWRANPERTEKASLGDVAAVNHDAVAFMKAVCAPYAKNQPPILIGSLMACRGDAYRPEEALDSLSAEAFHKPQARSLADAGVDYIMAATLPAFSEALGLARALAAQPVPYIISFIVNADGALLDNTPLIHAIERIDRSVDPQPCFYMVNCVHPHTLMAGLDGLLATPGVLRDRLLGIQANTSEKPPHELDAAAALQGAPAEPFAEALLELHHRYGMRILGGCCGTDQRHIEAVARRIKSA
jgi:homocysteine S-methyltransferase